MCADHNSSVMKDSEYAERLLRTQNRWWKKLLNVQWPYRAFLASLDLGLTLDIGCGVGRNLKNLSKAVGVDINGGGLQEICDEEFILNVVRDFRVNHS